MMGLKGETVILWKPKSSEVDSFGTEIVTEFEKVAVEDVLITPGASAEILDSTDLEGHVIQYTLHIPKTDGHDWTHGKVTIRGKDYRTIGEARYYTEANVPLRWNGEIGVERYE